MKAASISVGGIYLARVSGKITRVKVEEIIPPVASDQIGYHRTRYRVRNLATDRGLIFVSAAKFRGFAMDVSEVNQ